MQNDRRKFLFKSGATIGGFLVNPTAGVLGLVAATLAGKDAAAEEIDPARLTLRPLLRSAAPLDAIGRPFGGRVSSLSALEMPQALQKGDASAHFVLVTGHDAGPTGLSSFEVARTARGWNHSAGSHCNRAYGMNTPVPLDGARLKPDAPLFREQALLSGLGPVRATLVTPWNTVLCAETLPTDAEKPREFGWVVEFNPHTGSLVKKLSLGRVLPQAFGFSAEAGQPFTLYMLGGASTESRRLYKFASHQRFDGRQLQANALLLVMGELSVADVENGQWLPLSQGLFGQEWAERLREVSHGAGLPAPLRDDQLARESSGELIIMCGTERVVLRDPSLGVRTSSGHFVVEHDGDSSIVYSRERIGG